MSYKEIFKARSTNGRSGLAVVGPESCTLPCEGGLKHLGSVAGIVTYEVVPGSTGTWVMVAEDATVHGGATVVKQVGLQSDNYATVLLLGAQAVVEHHGYKRRSSRITAYVDGATVDIPASVLLAMGLIEAQGEGVEVVPPQPLEGAMASAFAMLRRA